MKNVTTGNPTPQAFITKGKQRVKQFNKTIYLKDGDNFEIELFNPKSNKVLAKINLNGKPISSSGIVLRPGERVFLERYIDTNNKFIFSTYDVNGDNKEVQNAIKSNGELRVEFYDEQYQLNTFSYTPYTTWYGNTSTGTIYSSNISTTGCVSYTDSSSSSNFSYYSGDIPVTNFATDNLKSTNKKIETGTIEKGDKSKQDFSYSYDNFNYYSTNIVTWQILPQSRKPITTKDIKVFCVNCGARKRKQSHNFCPNCGTKYE